MSMSSSRPYMMRAVYEWILDNDCTPYILVDAGREGVDVPQQYVKDGQIVLNISPTAVAGLHISNETVTFSGRFAGVARDIAVPVPAVLGIYARENGQGMLFELEEPTPPEPPSGDDDSDASDRKPERPSLKVVK